MKKTYGAFRKVVALIIGIPIVIVGIILIPLPGPGILVTLFGLFILSIEFAFVDKHYQKYRTSFKKIIQNSVDAYKKRIDDIDQK